MSRRISCKSITNKALTSTATNKSSRKISLVFDLYDGLKELGSINLPAPSADETKSPIKLITGKLQKCCQKQIEKVMIWVVCVFFSSNLQSYFPYDTITKKCKWRSKNNLNTTNCCQPHGLGVNENCDRCYNDRNKS